MGPNFSINLGELTENIRQAASDSASEEDLRVRVESILRENVLEPLKIPWGRYEYSPKKFSTLISGVRIDALHAQVVVEYEKPRTLQNKKVFEHALDQVKNGIISHAGGNPKQFSRYFGVVLDGVQIGFSRYRERQAAFDATKAPLDVNTTTIARFVEAIIGLNKKALDANDLLRDFGAGSEVSKNAIEVLYGKVTGTVTPRTAVLFDDWKRVFSQVCAYSPSKLGALKDYYKLGKGVLDVERLLFSLHTYFALIMKLLAAEISSVYWPVMGSYLKSLEDAYYKGPDKLLMQLQDLEDGGLFGKLGISNFLEGDYFGWYLDEWDSDLSELITGIVKRLSDYDPSTADLEPDRIKDLFKELYQNLVPQKVRHDLGEYYTPDWLAELVLNDTGFDEIHFNDLAKSKERPNAPLELRLLDPACGSGTFLVLAVKQLRQYVDDNWIDRRVALEYLTKNIVGFDLNPLAVLASRTNYLISIGDLLRERGDRSIEIPVYLADSILVERKPTLLGSSTYVLRTAAGEFSLPASVVKHEVLGQVLSLMEKSVESNYTAQEFLGRLGGEVTFDEAESHALGSLYSQVLKLEKESRNRIWLRVLKNSFAPLLSAKFDFVVGNPPWVNWENLPDSYRESTKGLWMKYGLFTLRGDEARLGGGKKDISMLFTYVSADNYLNEGGTLGFVITQTVLKTKGAADGFRRFSLPNIGLKVLRAHNLVDLKPFEGAVNRTSILVLRKGEKTAYPVKTTLWRRKGGKIDSSASLSEVIQQTLRYQLSSKPIISHSQRSPWIDVLPESLSGVDKLIGESEYSGYEGANTGGANGIYWTKVIQPVGKNLLIENEYDIGKRKFDRVQAEVERDLLFPLLRGRDISRWSASCSTRIILAQDPDRRVGIPERQMKLKFPNTYDYLYRFKKELLSRKSTSISKDPFYSMFGIGRYTMAGFKVVWAREARLLEASVCNEEVNPQLGRRTVIPDQTVMFIPLKREDEAYFVCAVLNSSLLRLIPLAYTIDITTHLLSTIRIPKFDPKDKSHLTLADMSKSLHKLRLENPNAALSKHETALDNAVADLYGLTRKELSGVQKSLEVLGGILQEPEDSPPEA